MEIRTLSPEQLLQVAVELGQTPRYLYKYCTVDSALRILENHSVWFATFDQFNDPFDCAMQINEQYTMIGKVTWHHWVSIPRLKRML